ncbi:acyltransferase 3 [Thermoanaerobacterium thermosaccharolyticum DSM 571]|uniref:Acyltransferase 3 n=1 Tax=Thermoanaerobacterium thermosaccharolyticum (strain ATCC 7956 / DSM 571 / NCIMB 9385 / NCA 3814 / NCTC 13789 / WDCM 00135 / 2032) TaxID=580327 RepID=D9TTK8_THETC|nr:acyltransferase family protein [Thermoanaerobacterium thermosaccharolyticum]ADL68265.1 acyltransferase 3 [Thermoanaerobacterium thermosaccharolyticum DSM 571]
MPKPLNSNVRYMAGLDGLRAIAVLAVIGYHLNLSFMQGGFLGVSIFFVLSGYLITNIISSEWERSGKVDLKNFWLRRMRRLFPALFIMVVLVVCYVTLFDPGRLTSIKGDAITSILYINNWWLIFHKVSYFAKFGPPSTFGNLWSLAVEGQFYLIWPLVLIISFKYLKKKRYIVFLTLLLAIASALAMGMLYEPGMDPSRVYYGTDTRVFGLLLGSALALILPSDKLSSNMSRNKRLILDAIGFLSLLSIFIMFIYVNQYDTFVYRGGMFLLSVIAAVTIAVSAHSSSFLGKALGCFPLRWLGARSYGVYLWYFPVLILTTPPVNTEGINPIRAVLQIFLIILISALSWRYVEDPIRHGALKRIMQDIKTLKLKNGKIVLPIKTFMLVIVSTVIIGIFVVGMSGIMPVAASTSLNSSGGGNGTNVSSSYVENSDVTSDGIVQNYSYNLPDNRRDIKYYPYKGGKADSSVASNDSGQTDVKIQDGKGITIIGDSILIDAKPYLEEMLPGITIDGKVGRQMYQAKDVVKSLKAEGKISDTLIVELGTNGPFTEDQLLSLLKAAEPVKHIILVNVRVPRPWESVVNKTLNKVSSEYPHTTLIDWYKASYGHDSFFSPDAVHLEPSGAKYFASLIAKTIEDNNTVKN